MRAPTVRARLAGVVHHCEPHDFSELIAGQPMLILREPENPYHPNAIEVLDASDRKFGYVDWRSADIVAPWMDKGWVYQANIINPPKYKKFPGGRMVDPRSVYLRLKPLRPIVVTKTTHVEEDA